MKIFFAFAAGVLASASILPATAIAADAPPGALSCSGCHSPNAPDDSTPPPLISGATPPRRWRRCGISQRAARRHHHGPGGEGLHPGRSPGHRHLVRRAQKVRGVDAHEATASEPPSIRRRRGCGRHLRIAIAADAGPGRTAQDRGGRGRLCRPHRGAHGETGRSRARRHGGRGEPDLHRLPVQQRRHRRPARHQGAAVRLRQGRRRRRYARADQRDRHQCDRAHGDPRQRQRPQLRPAYPRPRHRAALRRPPGLRRGRRPAHAACLEGRRADHAAAPPDRGDG